MVKYGTDQGNIQLQFSAIRYFVPNDRLWYIPKKKLANIIMGTTAHRSQIICQWVQWEFKYIRIDHNSS